MPTIDHDPYANAFDPVAATDVLGLVELIDSIDPEAVTDALESWSTWAEDHDPAGATELARLLAATGAPTHGRTVAARNIERSLR